MNKVIVIGGGITGLAAAYTLEKARQAGEKIDYLLLEQDERLGGKIFTEQVGGFTVEGGPDCFLAEKPAVFKLSRELGIYDELLGTSEENKGTFVLSEGKVHALPEGLMLMVPTKIIPFALSPLISWPGKLRMALDLVLPRRKNEGDESLAGFVTRRLGREALDKIAEPLIGGIHAGDPKQMSLKASFPRFLQMEQEHRSLTKAMLAARKKRQASKTQALGGPKITYFMSFKEGLGQLVKEVSKKIDAGKIRLGTKVTEISEAKSTGQKLYRVKLATGEILEAGAVIAAVPAHEAQRIFVKVDQTATNKLRAIPLASSATVNLAYKKSDIPRKLEGFGLLVPQIEKRRIMAITYTSRKWGYRVPGDDDVLFRVFVGGAKNQELVELDDREMLKIVREELESILGVSSEPFFYRIYRWVQGMPQYTLGHLERMRVIRERLDQHPGLYLVGASYDTVGIPNCIDSGSGAAQKAMEYLKTTELQT